MLELTEKTIYTIEDTRQLNYFECLGLVTASMTCDSFRWDDETWSTPRGCLPDVLAAFTNDWSMACSPDKKSIEFTGRDQFGECFKTEFIPRDTKGMEVRFYAAINDGEEFELMGKSEWSVDSLEEFFL